MAFISTAVINHNKRDLLTGCLESVKAQGLLPDEILLIDNASTDDSVKIVSLKFPDVKIVQNEKNLSFSAAGNEAIHLSKGEFILLLNNDVVLDRHFIEALLDIMGTDKRVGIAGGKLLSWDCRHIDSAGQFLARSRKIIDRGYREIDNAQYDKPGYVFGISASAALYRRTMLEDIKEDGGYFDEDFGFFYEDMDLAWRAQKRGWKAYYQPKAMACHKRGATTKQKRPRAIFLKKYYIPHLDTKLQLSAVRNRYLMMLKNDTAKDILKDFAFILWYEIRQGCYLLLFNPAIIIYMLKDRGLFIKGLQRYKNKQGER